MIVWKCPKDDCDETFMGEPSATLDRAWDHLRDDHGSTSRAER